MKQYEYVLLLVVVLLCCTLDGFRVHHDGKWVLRRGCSVQCRSIHNFRRTLTLSLSASSDDEEEDVSNIDWKSEPQSKDDVAEDDNDEYSDEVVQENSAIKMLQQFFDSVFFYGLQEEDIKAQQIDPLERGELNKFRRTVLDASLYTEAEILALYYLDKAERANKNNKRNFNNKSAAKKAKTGRKVPDRDEVEYLREQREQLQALIDQYNDELKVIDVTLAAMEQEDDLEEEDALIEDKENLLKKLKVAKIKLVTVESDLLDLQ